jgi:hypothetical protein
VILKTKRNKSNVKRFNNWLEILFEGDVGGTSICRTAINKPIQKKINNFMGDYPTVFNIENIYNFFFLTMSYFLNTTRIVN